MKNMEIYRTADKKVRLKVTIDQDTVWLNQSQISDLFERDRTVISRHIKNIFTEGELEEEVVCANFAHTTKHGALPGKTQEASARYYNLDVIISVGYRVKSPRGTQFRQWATQRLRDYLVQGYAINEKRLEEKQQQVEYLKTGIRILTRAIEDQARETGSETLAIFAKGLEILDDYDHEQLDAKGNTKSPAVYPGMEDYLTIIEEMRSQFPSDVFARPKDQSFESAIGQIQQSFGGEELYRTIEEKAAMLLYLIVKNHCFIDGNKRIGAACFLHFLDRNGLLFDENHIPVISNKALASLTLFTAVSNHEEMETVKRLIISILNR